MTVISYRRYHYILTLAFVPSSADIKEGLHGKLVMYNSISQYQVEAYVPRAVSHHFCLLQSSGPCSCMVQLQPR